jgi:hypothetical protein
VSWIPFFLIGRKIGVIYVLAHGWVLLEFH